MKDMPPKRWKKSWKERLQNPPKPTPRNTKWSKITDDSYHWNTCAVGEALGFPPVSHDTMRNVLHRPRYRHLCNAGSKFYYEVRWGHWDDALKTWKRIQTKYNKSIENIRKELEA